MNPILLVDSIRQMVVPRRDPVYWMQALTFLIFTGFIAAAGIVDHIWWKVIISPFVGIFAVLMLTAGAYRQAGYYRVRRKQ